MKNMKTHKMPINPNLLLTMDIARLNALKAAMEGFVEQFQKLIGMMDQDLETTKQLKHKLQGKEDKSKEREEPDGFVCIKIEHGDDDHKHCHCQRKHRGRR